MKKLSILAAGFMLVAVMLPSLALAQTETVEPTEPTETVVQEPVTADKKSNNAARKQDRMDAYTARTEAKLTQAEERKITNACKSAQKQTLKLTEKVSQVQKIRGNAYEKVSAKLLTLIERLDVANVDSTELADALALFDQDAEVFLAAVEEYQLTLTDLSELDCQADPVIFNAALAAAREQRVALVSSSQSLRKIVNDSIRPILKGLRAQLTDDTSDDTESTTEEPVETTEPTTDEPVESTEPTTDEPVTTTPTPIVDNPVEEQ